jgi:predicted DNA-binding mobile mystery protein A
VTADPKQLSKILERFETVRSLRAPKGGWIHAVRQARGLSLGSIAKRMDIHRQNVFQFEKSEERGQILLRNLRRIAAAMDCELIYAIVPKRDTMADLTSEVKHRDAKREED